LATHTGWRRTGLRIAKPRPIRDVVPATTDSVVNASSTGRWNIRWSADHTWSRPAASAARATSTTGVPVPSASIVGSDMPIPS